MHRVKPSKYQIKLDKQQKLSKRDSDSQSTSESRASRTKRKRDCAEDVVSPPATPNDTLKLSSPTKGAKRQTPHMEYMLIPTARQAAVQAAAEGLHCCIHCSYS